MAGDHDSEDVKGDDGDGGDEDGELDGVHVATLARAEPAAHALSELAMPLALSKGVKAPCDLRTAIRDGRPPW